jgi:hypothetical protein
MARKRGAKESPAKDGAFSVTYVGSEPAVEYRSRSFLRGVPTPVVGDEIAVYRRTIFEVKDGHVHP